MNRVLDMEFVVGYDLEAYKRYYRTLDDLHNYFRTLGLIDVEFGELGLTEEEIIKRNPSHLIVWRKDDDIIGHAVWHETSTDEHRRGDPRDEEDKEILRRLLGGKKDKIVELHELWLGKKYRGNGYGKIFFEFFEDFIREQGYGSIVYYTDNPAAIAICRRRGYTGDFLEKERWCVFCLSFCKCRIHCV